MKFLIIFLFFVNVAQAQFFQQCPPNQCIPVYSQPYAQPVYSQTSTFVPAPMPKNLVRLPKKAPIVKTPIVKTPIVKTPVIDYKKLAAEVIKQGGLKRGPVGKDGPAVKFNEKDLLLRIAKLEDQLKNIQRMDTGESSRPYYMQIREQK